jgi:hypothetical protein
MSKILSRKMLSGFGSLSERRALVFISQGNIVNMKGEPVIGLTLWLCRSSNKMPAAVREALRFAVVECGGKSEGQAREFVSDMETEGRLTEECWS